MSKKNEVALASEPVKTGATALTVTDPAPYPILDSMSDIADVVIENMRGEKISQFNLDQIKVPAGGGTRWTVPNAGGGEDSVDAIEGIVVYFSASRAYWASRNPTGEPPDCQRRDMEHGVGDPGGLCEACPMNEWGSAPGDDGEGKGKACKEIRSLFIIRPETMMPCVLSIPPASLKNFTNYRLKLTKHLWQVVTRFTLQREKNSAGVAYSQVKPTLVGVLPDDTRDAIKKYALEMGRIFAPSVRAAAGTAGQAS